MEETKKRQRRLSDKIPCKWRVQSFSKNKPVAICIPYIDARQVMDILDEVITPSKWKDEYKSIDGKLFCGISIKVGEEWVTKWDVGSETKVEGEKGEVSDSFKRAAVKLGIGRFLYSMGMQYVTTNDKKTSSNFPYPVDDAGNRIWDLTKFINNKNSYNK